MTATFEQAKELDALAKSKGLVLYPYQNRRWDSDYLTLKKLLSDGVLGDVAEVQTHFDRHRPDLPAHSWKVEDAPGHGAIYELGTHLIDQMYASFGMPERVTGFLVNQRRGVKGVAADSFTVLLHYEGMLVTAKAGVVSAAEEQLRYWVRGTKGSFQKVSRSSQMDWTAMLTTDSSTWMFKKISFERAYDLAIRILHEIQRAISVI